MFYGKTDASTHSGKPVIAVSDNLKSDFRKEFPEAETAYWASNEPSLYIMPDEDHCSRARQWLMIQAMPENATNKEAKAQSLSQLLNLLEELTWQVQIIGGELTDDQEKELQAVLPDVNAFEERIHALMSKWEKED